VQAGQGQDWAPWPSAQFGQLAIDASKGMPQK
jgi:hypothetical protein